MDRVVVDVERVRFRIGKGQGVERGRLEVYDFLALQAHEMMMTVSLGIEARPAAGSGCHRSIRKPLQLLLSHSPILTS